MKKDKILVHMCCAPCSIYPVKILKEKDFQIMGYFYPHNIHPYSECQKRQQALETYAKHENFRVIWENEYNLENFLQNIAFRESKRCSYCYHDRIKSAALLAKRGKFDYFTTSLLYSKFQNHEMIKSIGESMAKKTGVSFYYQDFRKGWKHGIEESKGLELYRQQYCGCIYSEKDRFYKK